MDLRKRLAALDRLSRKPELNREHESSNNSEGHNNWDSLTVDLQLRKEANKAGTVWVRNYIDDLDFPLGPLPDFGEILTGAHLAKPLLEEIFFLDTETTGLAGGTGTLAFLVGCSWFKAGKFHTRQIFLPGPGHESAVLQEIKNLSTGFSVVMTFNGASFDLPLLRTRALMNRVPNPLSELVSWDLLMAGRRLWGKMLSNCKQQTLEKNVCQIKRQGEDIDGALIPQTWFDFLASGKTIELKKVLYHNHRDMVGMGALFAQVVRQVSMLQSEFEPGSNVPWQECWALGRICEKRKDHHAAGFWLLASISSEQCKPVSMEQRAPLFQDSIRILKRSGDWPLVKGVIDQALELGIDEPWLFREAAMVFEHRLVDLSLALAYALRADDPHRVARLQHKLS